MVEKIGPFSRWYGIPATALPPSRRRSAPTMRSSNHASILLGSDLWITASDGEGRHRIGEALQFERIERAEHELRVSRCKCNIFGHEDLSGRRLRAQAGG